MKRVTRESYSSVYRHLEECLGRINLILPADDRAAEIPEIHFHDISIQFPVFHSIPAGRWPGGSFPAPAGPCEEPNLRSEEGAVGYPEFELAGSSAYLHDRKIQENYTFRYPVCLPLRFRRRIGRQSRACPDYGYKGSCPAASEGEASGAVRGPENGSDRSAVPAPSSARRPEKQDPRSDSAIFLLHGLNERRWSKYLPWAAYLCSRTSRPVIMLPVAYHLNRAPVSWGDMRKMMPFFRHRRDASADNRSASFANAALSMRLEQRPDRFFEGGMQTIDDLERLIRLIREGSHEWIAPDAQIHFFSYSIGCTLAEMLLMADEVRPEKQRILSGSRVCLFCGGSILEYARPVSRAILDDAAGEALNRFFDRFAAETMQPVHSDDAFIPADAVSRRSCEPKRPNLPGVREFQSEDSSPVLLKRLFAALIRTGCSPAYRMDLFSRLKERVRGFMIDTDEVFPVEGLQNSWLGPDGSALIRIEAYPGPPESSHVVPFPVGPAGGEMEATETLFHRLFADAADFLIPKADCVNP